MTKNKNLVLFYIIYLIYFVAQALSYCFCITFLTNIGYTAMERSIFFTVSAIFGAIVQFVVGYLCDKDQTIKKYANITFIVYVVFTIVTYLYTQKNFIIHLALTLGLMAMMRVTNGILDSWCLVVDDDCKKFFGSIRAMGSIGWALGSQIGQILIAKFGYSSLGYSFAFFTLIIMAIYSQIKDVEKKSDSINIKDVGKLMSNVNYIYVLLILLSLNMITGAQDTLSVDKFTSLNASEATISLYWSIGAIVELPLFFFGNKVGEKLGVIGTCAFTIIMYGVKFISFALAKDSTMVIVVSLLQFCTFPLKTIFSISLIDDESPDNMKVSGQQIGTAIYSGISCVLAPFLCGLIEDSIGVDNTLLVFSLFSVLALILLVIYSRNKKRSA